MANSIYITDLPDEILLEIFSYLSVEDLAMSAQHVSSHWKDVTQDDSLWKNQIFSPGYKMSDNEVERHLVNMPALRAFCPLRGINTKNIIPTMCKYCKHIRHIEFNWSQKLSNFRLQKIIENCPHLETLHISLPKEPYQLHCAILIGKLQNLTTLNLSDKYFNTVEDGVLRAIADGCPVLLHLDLGSTTFQDRDVQYLLKRKGPQLLSLSVKQYISPISHKLLVDCCGNLQNLWYANYNQDFPSMYLQLLSKLTKLCHLTLDLFNITNIFRNRAFSKLIKLDISLCYGVDDTVVTGILAYCPQLEYLRFQGQGISDDGFEHIGNCKNLEHLYISSCYSLTDKSMEYVGAGCPNLKHLDIACCTGLSNKSAEYVCKGCQKLKYLNMNSCPEMTDDVLKNIFSSRELKVLILSWNSQLLGTYFLLIPSNLIYLTELDVEGCISVDKNCLHELQAVMPCLRITGNHTDSEEPDVNLEDAILFSCQSM